MGKAKTFANLTYNAVHGAARQALRRWNVGFPRLGRKVVVGRVARKDENDFFHVSTGHKSDVSFHARELQRGLTKLAAEPLPSVGSKLHLMVRAIENPMGELELSNRERVKAERDAHVWEEIRRAYQRGGIVRGRVLNAVGGGYAVGIAGHVAFLPQQSVRVYEGKNVPPVGVLLPFKILTVRETIQNVVVEGPVLEPGTAKSERRARRWDLKKSARLAAEARRRDLSAAAPGGGGGTAGGGGGTAGVGGVKGGGGEDAKVSEEGEEEKPAAAAAWWKAPPTGGGEK